MASCTLIQQLKKKKKIGFLVDKLIVLKQYNPERDKFDDFGNVQNQ